MPPLPPRPGGPLGLRALPGVHPAAVLLGAVPRRLLGRVPPTRVRRTGPARLRRRGAPGAQGRPGGGVFFGAAAGGRRRRRRRGCLQGAQAVRGQEDDDAAQELQRGRCVGQVFFFLSRASDLRSERGPEDVCAGT